MAAVAYARENQARFLEELKELLRIPSISTLPEHNGDTRHAAETASSVATNLLADWETTITRFSKIMPRDYKRVIEAARAAEADGSNVDEAILAAAHG